MGKKAFKAFSDEVILLIKKNYHLPTAKLAELTKLSRNSVKYIKRKYNLGIAKKNKCNGNST